MQKQAYRLGIDIGTASIGLAAFSIDPLAPEIPLGLLAVDESIFGEPVKPGDFILNNEIRRTKRLMRRQTQRKKARLQQILHLGELVGATPLALKEVQAEEGNALAVWSLRAKALDQKISLAAIWLIALRMSKNRGYKGEIPTAAKSKLAAGIKQLKSTQGAYRTLAEALVKREGLNGQSRFRKLAHEGNGDKAIAGTFLLRSDVEAEFDLITSKQAEYYPELLEPLETAFNGQGASLLRAQSGFFHGMRPRTLLEALRCVLFHQRPLPSFKANIGKCGRTEGELRVGTAHPAFQRFRLAKLIAELYWVVGRTRSTLSNSQANVIRALLLQLPEASFQTIYDALEDHDCAKAQGARLNFHTARTTALKGDVTTHVMRSLKLNSEWQALSEMQRGGVITSLTDDLPSPEQWSQAETKRLITKIHGEVVVEFLEKLPKSEEGGLLRLANYGLPQGRAKYGVTACTMLAEWLESRTAQADNLALADSEAAAIEALFGQNSNPRPPITGRLLEPSELEISSPVVIRALRESHHCIKAFFERYGTPHSIVIELMREMRQSLEQRKEVSFKQGRREAARSKARKTLTAHGYAESDTNITRYLLWQEQAETCPYSGQRMSMDDALNGAITHFEHVLPKKLHGVGNRIDGLVLAYVNFNNMKADETPWAAAHLPSNKVKWDWNATVQACKAISKVKRDFAKKAALITNPISADDAREDLDGFVDRQFSDTAWIGREIHRWMQSVCSDVTVVRGGLTASLRHQWGLDTVLEQVRTQEGKHEKPKATELFFTKRKDSSLVFDKRSDHRHHVIDAAVIALSTQKLYTQEVKRRSERLRPNSNGMPRLTPVPCPIPKLREILAERLTNFVVWHKPDRLVSGRMFDEEPFKLLAEDQLMKRGVIASKKFKSKLDKNVLHTDRHGVTHTKTLVKAEFACLRIMKDDWCAVTMEQFLKAGYIQNGRLTVPKGERLLFKGDLFFSLAKKKYYRVSQLSNESGILCVEHAETMTFEDLKATGLNAKFSKLKELQEMTFFNNKRQLAQFIAARRNET